MHTENANKRRSRVRYALVVAIAAVVAAGGCEYLGLDQQSGGGGGSKGTNQQKDKANNAKKKKKGETGEESDSESPDKQAKAGSDESEDESGDKNSDETPKPPSLQEDSDSSGDDGSEEKSNRRRNPFASSPELEASTKEKETKSGTESSGPLQRYSYEKYRLAGLISEVAVPKAMFIAPDSVGHVLKKGDRIGKEGGVIQDIRENEVELELPPEGEEGRPKKVTIELSQAEVTEEQQKEKGLTEEEKKTLDRLLQSKEGRQQIRQEYKNRAAEGGRGGEEKQQQSGGFQGLEPPKN